MKCSEIKKEYSKIDITINSREANRILIDINKVAARDSLMPETYQLSMYLMKLIK